MYIRGLIPRNFAELAEAVPIVPTIQHYARGAILNKIVTIFICMLGNLTSLDLYK